MAKKTIFLFCIFIFIIIFFLLFLGLNKSNLYSPKNIENIKIENFEGTEIFENKKVNFYDILDNKGFTLLNIWASWCAPCREEHKFLLELSDLKELKIVGLNYKDKKLNAEKFILEMGNPFFKIITDEDGTRSIFLGAYGVPETFLIKNSNKKLIKKYIGPLNFDNYLEIKNFIK